MKVDVELDLSEPYGSGEHGTLLDEVLRRVAKDGVPDDARKDLGYRVTQIRDEEIRAVVRPMIEDAIAKTLLQTDLFGNVKDGPKTLSEVIVDQATKELRASHSRGNYSKSETLLQQVIREEVERAFRKELDDVIKEAKTEVVNAIRQVGAEVLTDTIARKVRA